MRGLLLTTSFSDGSFCFKYLLFLSLDMKDGAVFSQSLTTSQMFCREEKKERKDASVSLFLRRDVEEIFR